MRCSQFLNRYRYRYIGLFLVFLSCLWLLVAGSDLNKASAIVVTENEGQSGERTIQQQQQQQRQNLDLQVDSVNAKDADGIWRELAPGEPMPAGAHVRIDMSGTGKKYIKATRSDFIESEKDVNNTYMESGMITDVEEMERVLSALPEPDSHIKALNKLKKDDPEFYEKAIREIWKKRQVELKEAAEAIADETKMIQENLKVLGSDNATDSEILDSLENLESFVQSIDHALDYYKMGGLEITAVHLNSHKSIVRTNAAYVIGSASKSLNDLQDHARENLILDALTLLLQKASCDESTESNQECAKLLYAIASLVRGNPISQFYLAKQNFGLELISILRDPKNPYLDYKVRTKVVALLDDLLFEGENTCNNLEQSPDIVVIPLDSEAKPEPNQKPVADCPSRSTSELYEQIKNPENDLCNVIAENLQSVENCYEDADAAQASMIQVLESKLKQLAERASCE
mmetsp:Transcript_16023/g.19028  ORF Transcript_16023/g.19028 Transcript_16023/m.19028 type:complete len:460 (+) Transcript_16023:106-1485(+)